MSFSILNKRIYCANYQLCFILKLQRESSGPSKGVAIVRFADNEIASRALELFNGKSLGANIMYA